MCDRLAVSGPHPHSAIKSPRDKPVVNCVVRDGSDAMRVGALDLAEGLEGLRDGEDAEGAVKAGGHREATVSDD
jgi:hypothetical protein